MTTHERTIFPHEFDGGFHHVHFQSKCPCGEKFDFSENDLERLGACALCKNRQLHCAYVIPLLFQRIHVCASCYPAVKETLQRPPSP